MVFWRKKRPRNRELEEKVTQEVQAAMKEIEETFRILNDPIRLHESVEAFTLMSKKLMDGRVVRLIMIGRLSEEEIKEALEAYEKGEEKMRGSGWAVLVQKPG